MKKAFSIICAMLLLGAAASAEETGGVKFGVRIGISGSPKVANNYFTDGYTNLPDLNKTNMEYMYGTYHTSNKSFGTITAIFDVQLNNWFTASMLIGFNSMWHDRFNAITSQKIGEEKGTAFYLMPQAHFTYFSRPWVRLYGSIGIGVGKYLNYQQLQSSYKVGDATFSYNNSIKFESQFTPIGVEFGKKLFGFFEAGFGSVYFGIHGGLGYKF